MEDPGPGALALEPVTPPSPENTLPGPLVEPVRRKR